MKIRAIGLPILAAATFSHAQSLEKRWTLELESGLTTTRYNNAQVPNPSGSEVNLAGIIGKSWRGYGRVSVLYRDSAHGTWKLLYAPFSQSGSGTLAAPSNFAGVSFGAGAVNAIYRFDSYRFTYRKPWRGNWSIGATLKVRDAEIGLSQGTTQAREINLGFVPLLNIHGTGVVSRGLQYEIELDGLAGGPGRAFDLSARLVRELDERSTVFVGFRVLEGGADVPRVKNFAWISYFSAGLAYRF